MIDTILMLWLSNAISVFTDFSCHCFVVACQEIYQKGINKGDIEAMECLLNHLKESTHSKKWSKFVAALELSGQFVCVYSCYFSHNF